MIKIRCDDFDPRIDVKTLKPLHEEFVKRNVPFTIAVNNCMGDHVGFAQEVVDYVNATDGWDIQLHGFTHDRYWIMPYHEAYMQLFTNKEMTKQTFVKSNPTIFYPPWNESSQIVVNAAKELGLQVITTGGQRTTREFLKNWNVQDQDLFFWHWWNEDDRSIIPEVLDRLVETNKL